MNPYSINPPESDIAFEKLCLEILKLHWSRLGLERFAKKGEEQFGADIFDTRGESPMYAAQCKLKEAWKSLTPQEIQQEVDKAKTFPSKLDHYAILTTGKVSGAAQLAIQAINQRHRPASLFTVELLTWEKITDLIRQYPEVEQRFYGGLRSAEVAIVTSKLDYIATLSETVVSTSGTSEIDALIDEARDRLNGGDAQISILLLNRILRNKGGELTDWHRFRIVTNLGAANLILRNNKEAARYFLNAKQFRPDEELAIGNEVLAYHLLGDEDLTRAKAAAGAERFPSSARIRSLWIHSASRETSYEELLNDTPSHMRADAEVAFALSRRAIAKGLVDQGIEHAKEAVMDKPKWSQARLLLAQAYFARVALVDRKISSLRGEDRSAPLKNAFAAAEEGVSVAKDEGDSHVQAQTLALMADVALLEGRTDEAARFARESFAVEPRELAGRIAMAGCAIAMGNLSEGIRILEEAYRASDSAAHISYMLGQALLSRGASDDANRAFDVFSGAHVSNLDRELIDPIAVGAVRALSRCERWEDIDTYISRPEIESSRVLARTLKAYTALKRGTAAAGQLLDEAIKLRSSTDTRAVTDFLARLLLEAGRFSDALPLLEELFDADTPNFDVTLLLNCAARLKRDKVILDTCEVLHQRGVSDWEFQEFESQYLEEYDFQKAIRRLTEFIDANPEHRIAKLRRSIVGMRYGRDDIATVWEETLPPPGELPMRYAVPTVSLLQWQGKGKLAVEYAYRVLRENTSELEAHKAYLASVISESRPDIPVTLETVQVGSAVQYCEGDSQPDWFVLEDTEKPNLEFEELTVSSAIAKDLLGKRVGDTFVLAKSQIQNRVGTIKQILSKYTRRFQAIGDRMQLKFGDQSVIQTMSVPPPDRLTAADLQPMLDSVKEKSEIVSKLGEIYRSALVTVHICADKLGHSAYEGLMHFALSDHDFVRCAQPQIEVLAHAMGSLKAKSTVVLDLTALASLRLLGITRQILTSGAFCFSITPSTFTELQRLRAESRLVKIGGTLSYENGKHYLLETTEEQVLAHRAAYEDWMQCVESNVSVVTVPEVAGLVPERRETLESLFGRGGLESALMCLSPSHVLWTDDLVFGEVAKTELGAERVWSQAVVEHLANLGLLDRTLADEVYAKLLGFDYQATHFTGAVMVASLRISQGSLHRRPMRQMIRAFESLVTQDRKTAFQMLAQFLVKLSVEPMLPETKCVGTKAFLNTFPRDAIAVAQLSSFKYQCARLMSVNPVAQQDFIRCFDEWNREKFTVIL